MTLLAGRCALIVPCYNESTRLRVPEFVNFLREAPAGFRMVFVDDGSRDNTLEVLETLRRESGEPAVVLSKKPNAGKAEAVRYGMNYAIQELRPEVVGFWDADLATPLAAVPDLLGVLEQLPPIQMVFGARVKLLGRRIERKVSRHYLGRVFATVVSNVLDIPIYDTQCGAKIFRATPDFREILRDPFLSRWIFDVEIIARFIRLRGRAAAQGAIYEYPLQQWEDIAGSRITAGDFLRAAAEIVMIYNRYLRPGS